MSLIEFICDISPEISRDTCRASLLISSCAGYLDVVKFWIGRGSTDKVLLGHVAINAAASGHLHILTYVNENFSIENCTLALKYASEHGKIETSRYLIDIGADVNCLGINSGQPSN